jgi:asparagine synthase (glutamine-hydrolysing)
VLAEAASLYPRDLVRQAMYTDQHTFLCSVLDRNDRMTMGASIECRVPFLDYRLVEILAAMPTSVLFRGRCNKILLRQGLGYRLPRDVLHHRKWGFGVPWRHYLRNVPELRQILSDLGDAELLRDAPLDKHAIRQITRHFLTGDDRFFPLLMQLLMITLGWRTLLSSLQQPVHQ